MRQAVFARIPVKIKDCGKIRSLFRPPICVLNKRRLFMAADIEWSIRVLVGYINRINTQEGTRPGQTAKRSCYYELPVVARAGNIPFSIKHGMVVRTPVSSNPT